MRTPLFASLILAMAVSGCGFSGSALNPFNWFDNIQQGPSTLAPEGGYAAAKLDNRELVAEVTQLEIKRTQGGAIVSVTGLTPTQGWWNAELIADNDGLPVDGVMSYQFVIARPDANTPAAQRILAPESRSISVAAYIPNQRLEAVRKVIVTGANNARSVSR